MTEPAFRGSEGVDRSTERSMHSPRDGRSANELASGSAIGAPASPVTQAGGWHGESMVIFARTFDFLAWLLPLTNHFPKSQRHSVTKRLLDAALDLREQLEEANHRRGGSRRERLERADESLAKIRLYLRLAFHLRWITEGQYFHAARFTSEIGKLLGGWRRS